MPPTEFIAYDAENKIWSAPNYPHWNFINQSVGEAFLQQMRKLPADHVLEYFVDTDVQRTAGTIYRESLAVARNLMNLGLQKEEILVIYSMNNTKTTPLFMGGLLMGARVIVFETNLETENIDRTLRVLQPTAIFYEEAYAQQIAGSLKRSPLPSVRYRLSLDGALVPNFSSELLLPAVSESDLAHFQSAEVADPQRETAIFALTSGSTGVPKLVDISHSLLLHGVINWICHTDTPSPPTRDLVVFSFAPLRWISQVDMMPLSVLFGAKRICASKLPSGPYGREIIRKGHVTHGFFAPQIFQDTLDAVDESDKKSLSTLRVIQLGGESHSKALRQPAQRRCGNAKIYCCYGMTELGGVIANDEYINGGKLLSGLQLQILDDDMRPLGPNQRGQLYMKAPVPFRPYLRIDNSGYYFADGFFLNGDYGFVDEQRKLHVESRYKDLIRAKDVIIIPNNVEYLVGDLPEVAMARLVGYKKSTESTAEVGALFVILKSSANALATDFLRHKIRDVLEANLSPRESANIEKIHLVSKIPLTSCGKVDRIALRQQARSM